MAIHSNATAPLRPASAMPVLLSFALALLLTTVLLPICIRFAALLGLVDSPEAHRKVHTEQIPRSGGLAIVAGSLIAAGYWIPFDAALIPLFASMLIIVVSGLADDLFDLTSAQKLIGQVLAAIVFLAGYGGFDQIPFFPLDQAPAWLCLLCSFVFLVGVTNAINLSDGLDGLAAGNSLLSLGLLALLAAHAGEPNYMVLALALAGGLLGFLRFNTHPARLFMGDTGAQFLGFSAAALTVLTMREDTLPVSPVLPLLLFGLPILDTVAVMGARAMRRRPLFKADRTHLHHQFLRVGFKHYEVVAILYALQATIVGLAYVMRYQSDLTLLAAYVAYATAVLGFVVWARLSGFQAHRVRAGDAPPERRNYWLRRLHWYYRHTAKVLGLAVGGFLVAGALVSGSVSASVSQVAWISVALLVAAWLYFRENSTFVCRLISFAASVTVVYAFLFSPATPTGFLLAADVCMAGIGIALALAIRLTRKSLFHLDNQDYLVLFIVAAVPFLPLGAIEGLQLARVALYLAILLYACEYVASKGEGSRLLINGAGLAALALLGAQAQIS